MSTEIKKALNISSDYDKKSSDFLSKALASSATNGFDYIKYRQALKAMEKMGLDESTAFKSAFATASTMGLTKSGLVNSAKHYLSVLMDEKGKFDEALNNRVKEQIASKRDMVLKLEQRIDEMKKKIAELEAKVAEYQQKIDVADDALEVEKKKIASTQQNFETTFNAFVSIIEDDIKRIDELI